MREALAIMRSVPNFSGEAYALRLLGDIALGRGDLDEAARLYAESRAKMEAIGNPGFLLGVLTKLGELAYVRGDADQARNFIQ